MRVTFFDVEYANIKNKSICQLGILSRDLDDDNAPVDRIDLYINPEDGFDDNCIRIHGISSDLVKNKPSIKEVWNDIEKYFTNSVVIGHNVATADIDALHKNLLRYDIAMPEIYYVCTYQLAKQVVPSYVVSDYALGTLCDFFNIKVGKRHNAFHDACACSDLLDCLESYSHWNIEDEIEKYEPSDNTDFIAYISGASLKKDIQALYGTIKGFSLDMHISEQEKEYLIEWKEKYFLYSSYKEIAEILDIIDNIVKDSIVTSKEIMLLQRVVRKHLDVVSTSTVTLATRILNGIMRGMLTDDVITEEECQNLRIWLYENNYLAGHFPFDKLFDTVERVLEDEVLTLDEANLVRTEIIKLLDPVESLRKEVSSLKGKHVCLSGNFAYGQKSAVEKYIIEQGGFIDSNVKKDTDILIVGDYECQSYSNGTYGTKVKKAIEYNSKGCDIQISKESDIIMPEKSFSQLLMDYIDRSGKSDVDIYKKAMMPRQMMSKIRKDDGYKPTKQNICAFAIALKLNLDETNKLLTSAGYILSHSIMFDRIIEDAIVHNNYDIDDINEKLYENDQPCMGTK